MTSKRFQMFHTNSLQFFYEIDNSEYAKVQARFINKYTSNSFIRTRKKDELLAIIVGNNASVFIMMTIIPTASKMKQHSKGIKH